MTLIRPNREQVLTHHARALAEVVAALVDVEHFSRGINCPTPRTALVAHNDPPTFVATPVVPSTHAIGVGQAVALHDRGGRREVDLLVGERGPAPHLGRVGRQQ
jgi:hypothetical protein